jgi:hypothetical protein
MDFSQLSEENYDIELSKVFAKFDKIVSPKELKKVKQGKESLIIQLSESHGLIESLKSKNTMLLNTINELENKLEKFSSEYLKSMLCIHSNVSNKPDLTVDDLSTYTSHASDFELDSIDIKPVIEDTTFLDNSCLTNHVMPKSKESRTQGKFIPKCHNCGKIGHIRPNCYLLKSHRPWIKQDTLRKSEVEDSSPSKYVPPHKRHIKGKDNIVCKNANHISAEQVKQHSNKRSLPTCHHYSITGDIRPKCLQLQAQKKKAQRKLPTKTTSGTLPSARHQVPRHQRLVLKNTSWHYKEKPQKPDSKHAYYEGLLNLLQGMLRRIDSMSNTRSHLPRYTRYGSERMRPLTP